MPTSKPIDEAVRPVERKVELEPARMSQRNGLARGPAWERMDTLCGLLLSSVAVIGVLIGCRIWGNELQPLAVRYCWFDGDTPRVLADMTDVHADHYRSNVHPLFMTFAMPVALGFVHVIGVTPIQAAWLLNAAVAGLWLPSIFATLRLIGCARVDSMVLAALAGVSSGAIFWFMVPETYPLGSLSIVVCLLLAATSMRFRVPDAVLIVAAALSLSITVTNWMAGWALAIIDRKPKRAFLILVSSLALVGSINMVQKLVFNVAFANKRVPTAMFHRPGELVRLESKFFVRIDPGSMMAITRGELIHSIVMPMASRDSRTGQFSIQSASAFSTNLIGATTVVLWGLMLVAGLVRLVWGDGPIRFRLVLGGVLLGQVVLHILYGPETFLYALHFVPLLILLVGLATLSTGRRLVVALAVPAVLFALVNNVHQLDRVARMLGNPMPSPPVSVSSVQSTSDDLSK